MSFTIHPTDEIVDELPAAPERGINMATSSDDGSQWVWDAPAGEWHRIEQPLDLTGLPTPELVREVRARGFAVTPPA